MNTVLIHYTVAPGARSPTHVVPGGTTLNLYAHLPDGPIEVEPCSKVRVRTGVCLALSPGCVAQLRTTVLSMGGAPYNYFEVMDVPGIIDEEFREEIVVTLQNGFAPQSLYPDMRIAQLVVCPVGPVRLVPTTTLPMKSSKAVFGLDAVIKNDLLPDPCPAPEGFTWQSQIIFELVGPNGLCARVVRIGDSWVLYNSEMDMIKIKVNSKELTELISELSNSLK